MALTHIEIDCWKSEVSQQGILYLRAAFKGLNLLKNINILRFGKNKRIEVYKFTKPYMNVFIH